MGEQGTQLFQRALAGYTELVRHLAQRASVREPAVPAQAPRRPSAVGQWP
jgi:hypothetical protein